MKSFALFAPLAVALAVAPLGVAQAQTAPDQETNDGAETQACSRSVQDRLHGGGLPGYPGQLPSGAGHELGRHANRL